jgi:hypothetical protein
MALGARQRDVLALVVKQGPKLVMTGLATGLACALILTRLLATLLYGVSSTDPLTFVSLTVWSRPSGCWPATFPRGEQPGSTR